MRYFIALLLTLAFAGLAFAASGDKTPANSAKFHIISSSTKAAKAPGELRYSAGYLYVNISTAVRPHWRRVSLGASF